MARIERRTLADGTSRYKAIVRRKGAPMKTRTHRTLAAAEKWARKVENAIDDGRQLPSRDQDRRTLGELVLRYSHREPRKDTAGAALLDKDQQPELGGNAEFLGLSTREQAKRRAQLDWWVAQMGGDRKLARVAAADIREALAGAALDGKGPATLNRYLAALRAAFTFAEGLGWVTTNPCRKKAGKGELKLSRTEPRGRVRFLTSDERRGLLAACEASADRRLYPLVVLALSTGARQGELLSLRWPDVDLERGVAVVHHTKNGERRALSITGKARAILADMGRVRRIATDLVFADPKGRATFPEKAWRLAVGEAGLEDYRFHDCRHSAASYMAMSGATLAELAAVLGHKTLAMVQRYAHLSDQHTAGVVERMNSKFLGGA